MLLSLPVRVTNGVTIKRLRIWEIQHCTFKRILFDKFVYKLEKKVKNKAFIDLYQKN